MSWLKIISQNSRVESNSNEWGRNGMYTSSTVFWNWKRMNDKLGLGLGLRV